MTQQQLDQLTPEQRRVLIAERCGYEVHDAPEWRERYIITPDRQKFQPADPRIPLTALLPNFCDSLDAIAQAEATLSEEGFIRYGQALFQLLGGFDAGVVGRIISATAAQRAEAFLRVVNP